MKGRVALFHGPGKPFELTELEVPEPEAGAVLVRVKQCNICGSDIHAWEGRFRLERLGARFPTVLGHEMFGTVAAVGPGVGTDCTGEPLGVGDRVVFPYFFVCGKCANCLRGRAPACSKLRMAMVGTAAEWPYFIGGFADYFYLPPGHVVFKVPAGVPDDLVAGANCALAQVWYGLKRADLRPGETVVVQGAGGLGLYAVAVARAWDAGRVIVLDGVADRLHLARQFGADYTVNISELPDAAARVKAVEELTDGKGADIVVEVVGSAGVIPEGLRFLGQFGRYLEIGTITYGEKVDFEPARLVVANKSVIGVSLYEPFVLKDVLGFLARHGKTFPFERLFGTKFGLTQIQTAFEKARRREVVRASIVMD